MDLELLAKIIEEHIPFNKFLGVLATRVEQGFVRLELPFREELLGDPHRPSLHGGVISMLADTAGGLAIFSSLDNMASRVSTIDIRIDYLRPARPEQLAAEATVVRVGGKVGVADIRLFHPPEEGVVVATAKGVYAIRVPKQQIPEPQ
jgi:uncharacterized protein (TIGR00369 family)